MSEHDSMSPEVLKQMFEGCDFNTYKPSGLNLILLYANGGGISPNLPILDYLLDRDDITRINKIFALEIAGAVLLGRDENQEKFPIAFQYLRRSVSLRLMDTEECRPLYKTPVKSKTGQLSEWVTLDDLDRVEQLPPDQRKIQCLLVRLRICASIGWKAVENWIFKPILQFLSNMDEGVMSEVSISSFLDLTWITMETIFHCERPVELMLLSEQYHHQAVTDYLHMLNLCFMFTIISLSPEFIDGDLELSLLQLVNRDVRDGSGSSLLHHACRSDLSPCTITIRFLVKLGADPNAVNNVGDGVLHILAQEPATETRDATARLLLELGSHLDMTNKEGLTAADVWLKKNKLEKKDVALLPDWLQEGVPKLMCLSSRIIRRHKLPYDDGAIIPAVLIPFVSLH